MNGSPEQGMGVYVMSSVLDLFILSLLERGLQTPYDLHQQGGLSLGSTVPALRRLTDAGLIRKRDDLGTSKRPRHSYQLSAKGRTQVKTGWTNCLKTTKQLDLDAILRVVDMAEHYNAKTTEILLFLKRVVSERQASTKSAFSKSEGKKKSFAHMAISTAWSIARLKAEAKFLAGLSDSIELAATSNAKRRLSQRP
jgi:DNA-binding PadR family transcriptional regulator